jgi:mannosylglycoprotein endo-beta-mannosidase
MTHDIPQLLNEENEILVGDFTEQEVYDAIFQMEKNKAPGPDGFSAEFYQKLWEVIKVDLKALFKAFQEGSPPLF